MVSTRQRGLDSVERKLASLIEAIADGIRAPGVQRKLDNRIHPAKLSITHKFGSDADPELDVRQPVQSSTHDDVAGWWIAFAVEIPRSSSFEGALTSMPTA